jgi:protein-S-isoprenylcysteine O-methyltransferase Ste14
MTTPSDADLVRKLITRTLLSLAFVGLLLFIAAGRLNRLEAWVYLGLMAAVSIAVGLWLLRSDPGLLEERLRPMIQRDQKPWDKGLMVVLLLLWSSWLVLTGLDAGRYHWSTVPLAGQLIGAPMLCAGVYGILLVALENSYAGPVVRIQKERGHKVVTTGPYAYVRHPMYAAALLFVFGAPLPLGS